MEQQFVLIDNSLTEKGVPMDQAIVKYLGESRQTVFNSLEEVKEAALQSELKGTYRVAKRKVSPWEYDGEVML